MDQVYNPEVGGLREEEAAQSRPEGSHGTGYRFMPVAALPNALSPVRVPGGVGQLVVPPGNLI